jgi:hypothetical protein
MDFININLSENNADKLQDEAKKGNLPALLLIVLHNQQIIHELLIKNDKK